MIYQYWFNHLLVSISMVNTIDHGFVLLFEQNSPLGRVVMIVIFFSHTVFCSQVFYTVLSSFPFLFGRMNVALVKLDEVEKSKI